MDRKRKSLFGDPAWWVSVILLAIVLAALNVTFWIGLLAMFIFNIWYSANEREHNNGRK